MDWMAEALDLADEVKGSCSPNPAVGAVVVKDGRIVGRGATQPKGQAHAEIVALQSAGEAARDATLYVTLEPCGESKRGLTGPCSHAIVEAGVREVRIAVLDPSPWVDGRGKAELEQAGLLVAVGESAARATRLNEDYFKFASTGLPWVTVKYAMTVDGKIATRTGASRWITGPAAREWVGRMRSRVDAVLVGAETVRRDDPALTARDASDQPLARQPLRVVLDSRGTLPRSARLLDSDLPGASLIVTTEQGRAALAALPDDILCVVRADKEGHVDLRSALRELAQLSVVHVLVEAGGRLVAAFLEQGLVDRIAALVAPKIVGGAEAPTPVGGSGVMELQQAVELEEVSFERLGGDLLIQGYIRGCSLASSKR